MLKLKLLFESSYKTAYVIKSYMVWFKCLDYVDVRTAQKNLSLTLQIKR